jgi:hypothetical protein
MRRTNTFELVSKHPERVTRLAVGCAVLWNILNFKRRQSFLRSSLTETQQPSMTSSRVGDLRHYTANHS